MLEDNGMTKEEVRLLGQMQWYTMDKKTWLWGWWKEIEAFGEISVWFARIANFR